MKSFLLFVLLLLGCSENPSAEWPTCSYSSSQCQRLNARLVVTPELCESAISAAVEWCTATNGLACPSVVCGDVPAPRPYAIALAHHTHGPRLADTWPDGRIVVYGRFSAGVLAHEMGHFFGLAHDENSGTIMCRDIGCASGHVTARDAMRLRESLGPLSEEGAFE